MSGLEKHLEGYLQLRRQLGYQLRVTEVLLRNFVRHAEQRNASFITTQLAVEWAANPDLTPGQRGNRLGMVRRFAKYVSARDDRTEIPSQKLLPYQFRRRPPYLYSEEEVRQLIGAAHQIAPEHALKGTTYGTLFGLLAITGMRVGEALTLDREDVDLNRNLLVVRHGKGGKSRLVPIHPRTGQALSDYARLRDRHHPRPPSPSFLISEKGTRLLHCTVNRWFLLVACQLGWRKPGDRRGPRVHDLRHYFAVRTLLKWYRSETDVEAKLPHLATYLGHTHVRDTYWYLSAAPELLQLATRRLERRQKGSR